MVRTSRNPIAPCALAAGVALWALAIPPTLASAVGDNPSAGECRAPKAGDTVIWNDSRFCAVDQRSGGGGTGGAGSAPGNPILGVGIWASADAPRDPVAECLRRNARRCLADQLGGRGLEIDDGDRGGAREPRGRGGRQAGKRIGETQKGSRPEKLTRERCKALVEDGSAALDAMKRELDVLGDELDRLRFEREELKARVRAVASVPRINLPLYYILTARLDSKAAMVAAMAKKHASRVSEMRELEMRIERCAAAHGL